MKKFLFMTPFIFLFITCNKTPDRIENKNKDAAERFFRGVYGCNPAVVDELASDSVVVSYPIFKQIYNTYTIRGREEVKRFASKFCSRWSDAQFIFHNAISEGNNVILIWSFQARLISADSSQTSKPPANQIQSWGGITLYRFDEAGKIVTEVGEESAPGPIERLGTSNLLH